MKSQTIDIQLLGQKITLKSSGDPEVVQEVVDLVKRKIGEAEGRKKGVMPPHHVALLALLDMAEEYVQAKRRVAAYQREVDDKSREIQTLIQTELK